MQSVVEGAIRLFGVCELLQTLAFHHRSVRLEIDTPQGPGYVRLEDGEVVDAARDDARGPDALFPLLMAAQGGVFRIRETDGEAGAERTIALPLNTILLRVLAELPPDDAAGQTATEQRVNGTTRLLGVQELLQIFEANQKGVELLLARDREPRARLVFADGGLVSAEAREGSGPEAVYAVLREESLRYRVQLPPSPPDASRLLDISGLVVEGLRRLDEERLRRKELSLEHNVHAEETLARLEAGELDGPARLAIARQYLPGGEAAPAGVVARVAVDPDPEIRRTALGTILGYPEAIREALASDPDTPPPLLAYLLEHDAAGPVRAAAFDNPATPVRALTACMPQADAEMVARLGEREELLRSHRDLRRALRGHPDCTFVARLEEMDRTEGPRLRTRSFAESEAEEAALVLTPPVEDERKVSPPRRLGPRDIQYIVRRGSLRQKMKLVCGNDAEVAVEVVKSPAVPETAIAMIAENTTAHPAALAHIAGERRFRQNAIILNALIFNPKTPVHASMPLLPMLRADQLERVAGSRDVPDGLKQAAIGLLDKKKRKPKK